MSTARLVLALVVGTALAGCNGDTPTSPVSRVIRLSGNLIFGDVRIGTTETRTFTIGNEGTRDLTFTAMAAPPVCAAQMTISTTRGIVTPGGVIDVRLHFTPLNTETCDGILEVIADQSSGVNATAVRGRGSLDGVTVFALSGRVYDAVTGAGISGAALRVSAGFNLGSTASAASDGRYALTPLAGGAFTVSVAATGYKAFTQTMNLASDTQLDVPMQPN